MRRALPLALLLSSCAATAAPVELGDVNWRSWDQAQVEADKTGKPLLVLFDEVPGCATVCGYGERVLKHPLIVEAAEDLFVPVLVKNNVGGRDREILTRFGEPTWNNPVVRIIDSKERPLAARVAGDYTVSGLARAMRTSLGKRAPRYLDLAIDEDAAPEIATFSMYCFWTGEVALGELPGVLWTRPGFLDGHEVVDVGFDPRKLNYADLVKHAAASKVADRIYTHSRAQLSVARRAVGARAKPAPAETRYSAKDDDYQIRRSAYLKLGLTPLQLAKVNSAVGRGRDPSVFLTPRQRQKLHDQL